MKTFAQRITALCLLAAMPLFAGSFTREIQELQKADEEFLGVARFEGGLVKDLAVDVETTDLVKYFRVAIPSYCRDIEVLKAATVTEGVTDIAKRISQTEYLFAVAGGNAQRIKTVLLTLLGPDNVGCNIPVFQRKSGTPPPPPPPYTGVDNPHVNICNHYRTRIHFALGFMHQGALVTQGIFPVDPNTCALPRTASYLRGTLYIYGYSVDGLKVWGSTQALCVASTSPFLVTQDACRNPQAGGRLELFARYELTPGVTLSRFTFQ